MDEEKFRATVSRLELDAAAAPRAYQLKTLALATLGYLYIYGSLALAGGFAYYATRQLMVGRFRPWLIGLAIGSVALLIGIVRALWVRMGRAEGIELKRADAPELFRLLDKVRKRTGSPRVHRVLVTDDFNAAVSQYARLGLLGWHENALILGLPYMMAADIKGFVATVAHEFGHLAGSHGKIGAWLYRLRLSWGGLIETLRESASGYAWLLAPFVRLYGPYFLAYTFVLARQQEYEADRLSREVVGSQPSGDDLALFAIANRYLHDEFWPSLYREADTEPMPGKRPMARLQTLLKNVSRHPQARKWLDERLARASDVDDTHPSLRDRLDALDAQPRIPPVVKQSAAEALLGARLPELIERLDQEWYQRVRKEWKARYEQAGKDRERRYALQPRVAQGFATADEMRELVKVCEKLGDAPGALQAWQALLRREPRNPEALFHCGRLQLKAGDAAGVQLLQQAAQIDPDATFAAHGLAADFLEQQGKLTEASALRRSAQRHGDAQRRAEQEGETFTADDQFERAPLASHEVYAVRKMLAAEVGVRSAYLVRKVLRSAPDRVLLVLAIDTDPMPAAGEVMRGVLGLRLSGNSALYERIYEALSLSHECLLVDLEDPADTRAVSQAVSQAIKSVPGALLK